MLLFDVFSEMSGTADKVQDIMRIKAFFWFKVSKEVCYQWLNPYDTRQIANDSRRKSTEAINGPIKDKRVS